MTQERSRGPEPLNDILDSLTSCELELQFNPPNPEDPGSVEIYLPDPNNPGQQVFVPQVDCSQPGAAGWWYPNAPGSYTTIELCGSFCDTLLSEGTADVQFFCTAG